MGKCVTSGETEFDITDYERENLYEQKKIMDECEYKYKLQYIEFAILQESRGIDLFINLKIGRVLNDYSQE